MEKAQVGYQGPDSLVRYSTESDLAVENMLKSQEDSLYSSESPQVTPSSLLINQQVVCKHCNGRMAKSLAVCPRCGAGVVRPQVLPVRGELAKSDVVDTPRSRPGLLRPAKREPDLVLPDGVNTDDME